MEFREESGEDLEEQRGPATHIQLSVDAPQMRMHRVPRNAQRACDPPLCVLGEKLFHHLCFARTQLEVIRDQIPLALVQKIPSVATR